MAGRASTWLAAGALAMAALALPTWAGAPQLTATPDELAAATAGDLIVTGAMVVKESTAPSTAVYDEGVAGFPSAGPTFTILSTGDAACVHTATCFSGPGGDAYKGAYDVTVLRLDFTVPDGHDHIGFDVRFLSEETGCFSGFCPLDTFLAELDVHDWKVVGFGEPLVVAPHNVAFDEQGQMLTPFSSATEEEAVGTSYARATCRLREYVAAAPGPHSIFLSIFDVSDPAMDSAAFVDGLHTAALGATTPSPSCAQPLPIAVAPDPPRACLPVDLAIASPEAGLSYSWHFGDGTSALEASDTVSHLFPSPGTYLVQASPWSVPVAYLARAAVAPSACTASMLVLPLTPTTCSTTTFTADTDPDLDAATYFWDFGDGATAVTATPTVGHEYGSAGTHTATLTVAPTGGNEFGTTAEVTVHECTTVADGTQVGKGQTMVHEEHTVTMGPDGTVDAEAQCHVKAAGVHVTPSACQAEV